MLHDQQIRKRSNVDEDIYKKKRQCIDIQNNLPVFDSKKKLLNALEKHQIVIVTGETGSGKSTQIPQYLAKAGYCKLGRIAVTQPRRVGAISLANRVSEEVGCAVGDQVGYSIRFEKCANSSTDIVYMTDGVLLRELQVSPLLDEYSVVIIDEAHERTIQTDALLGIMKTVLQARPKMRLLISSATLNAEQFAKYYNASILRIHGRVHDVHMSYHRSRNEDYVIDAVERVLTIHHSNKVGDVLVFLAGQEDIDRCVRLLEDHSSTDKTDQSYMYVLPAYSSLPKLQLARIFEPTPKNARKIVVATNIAETSLTIDGIRYVVDSGFVKQKTYNHFFGIDQLLLTQISRAQADQRAGRAGRTNSGTCYRMYSRDRYDNKMLASSVPEIQRANLSNTVLQLKAIGIEDVGRFDFIDPPDRQRLHEAITELQEMSALNKDGRLTVLGQYMAQMPLDPILSKILIMSSYRECSEEVLIVVAMICVQNIFDKPRNKTGEADKRRQDLQKHQGDHITLLSIFVTWRDNDYSEKWCQQNFLRYSGLKQAQSIRNQLAEIMEKSKLKIVSCGTKIVVVQNTLSLYYFRKNAARKEAGSGYRTLCDDQLVYLHPSSALFRRQPEWVVFHDIMATTQKYMREVTKIHAAFLRELVPYNN